MTIRILQTLLGQRALGLAALLVFSLTANAQQKIATVDLKKIFDGYYKTKQADQQLKDRAGEAEKVLKGMLDDFQKANEEYKKLSSGAADQAASSEERDKRKKSAEAKLIEIQEIERQVKQFRTDNIQRLEDQKRRMRDSILREIREVITTKARAGGFQLVFDTAAESINQTPIIVFSTSQSDLTDEVLGDLNAKAPPGSLTGEKPDAPKSGNK